MRRTANDWDIITYRLQLVEDAIEHYSDYAGSPRHRPDRMFAFDGGYNLGQVLHTVLPELGHTIERHPAIQHASGEPPGQFIRVVAILNPTILGSEADEGTLTIRWYAGETADANPEFAFHYSDSLDFDCGWHHEPNPHVDGWAHYQERPAATDEYEYAALSFSSLQPVPLLWEVLDRLEYRLRD